MERGRSRWWDNVWPWAVAFAVIVVISTIACTARQCNNFLIFRAAFGHLAAGVDLYAAHPGEHADLFKYSPAFALAFAPFAALPFVVALLLWNVVNAFGLFFALRAALPGREGHGALALAAVGLATTTDGSQSNALIAALVIAAFVALERDRVIAGASAIALASLIKIFPLAALSMALPRRDRLRVAIAFGAVFAALVLSPLLVTSWTELASQHRSWLAMGAVDATDRGASVMAILHDAIGYDGPNWPVQIAGALVMLLPLAVLRDRWRERNVRLRYLASVLVFSLIFNHKAEQPSFIIGLTGLAIWQSVGPASPLRRAVTASAFLLTIPPFVAVVGWHASAAVLVLPLELITIACLTAWLAIQVELFQLAPRTAPAETEVAAG